MAQPMRHDPLPESTAVEVASPWGRPVSEQPPSGGDYAVGGQVGQMHAELVQRLVHGSAMPVAMPEPAAERIVRTLSRTGGYAVLVAAYAGIAIAVLR